MEKLSLNKFQDFEIKDAQMSNLKGGVSAASGESHSCSTNPSWYETDTQTDFYGDDGSYAGSSLYTINLITNTGSHETW